MAVGNDLARKYHGHRWTTTTPKESLKSLSYGCPCFGMPIDGRLTTPVAQMFGCMGRWRLSGIGKVPAANGITAKVVRPEPKHIRTKQKQVIMALLAM